MTEQIHLTKKERHVYFYKLLLFYGIGLVVFALIIFWKGSGSLGGTKENRSWKAAYEEDVVVGEKQYAAVQLIDSMSADMQLLKGEARQIFLERDIQNLSKQLRALYNENGADLRYMAFLQAGDFMNMRLEDIQTLNKKLGNVRIFEQQLNECQIGFRARQQASGN